jgi:hypothetical protein
MPAIVPIFFIQHYLNSFKRILPIYKLSTDAIHFQLKTFKVFFNVEILLHGISRKFADDRLAKIFILCPSAHLVLDLEPLISYSIPGLPA